ncbi:hypothetical protein KKF38_02705 [Patescibacteria group bacterium]|nr:hypothetical protein [Patescibacteria group bacterium]
MKIFPPNSQRLLLLTLCLTVVACNFVFGLPGVVEAVALKGYLLATGI